MEEKSFFTFYDKGKNYFWVSLNLLQHFDTSNWNSPPVVTCNANCRVFFYLRTQTVLDLVVSLQVSFRSCQIFFMSGRKPARKLLAHFCLRRGWRRKNRVEPTGSASNKIFGPWSKRLWVALLKTEKDGWRNSRTLVPPMKLKVKIQVLVAWNSWRMDTILKLPQRESQAQM